MQSIEHTELLKSKRITLVDKEKYSIDLEFNEGLAILHLPFVEKFTKSVYLDSVETLRSIKTFLTVVGYEHIYAAVSEEDNMMSKLVDRYGFTKKGNADGYDVYILGDV